VVAGRFTATVGIVAVPSHWTLTGIGYRGAGCETWNQAAIGRGRDFCLGATGWSFSGAFYRFGDKKRSTDECESSQRADQLGLEDGSVYDIADLTDDQIDDMVYSPVNCLIECSIWLT
jgi:hypothetical protein